MGKSVLIWTRLLCTFLILILSLPAKGQILFEEVVAESGIQEFNAARTFGSGVNAIDFDNDGDIDLFVPTGDTQKCLLYRNNGSGVFEEVSEELQLEIIGQTHSSLWFDINGDRLLDLIVGGVLKEADELYIQVYRQEVSGSFTNITSSTGLTIENIGRFVGGFAAGDINNDGFLDIFYGAWQGHRYLYMNNGDETFTNVTNSTIGLTKLQHLQPIFFDMNNDGFSDLNLNIDEGPNEFWLNNGDMTFSNIAPDLGIDSRFNEMGTALGDYDNDGDMEIYMTNIYGPERHNVFFRNDSDSELKFTEVSHDLGVEESGWGWGTTFFDADNDGHLDLAATDGWVVLPKDQSKFWKNNGGLGFSDISEEVDYAKLRYGTSLVAIDIDRDGDLDLVESLKPTEDQPIDLSILKNKLIENGTTNNYFVVKPRMLGANHFAIGSTVQIVVDGQAMIRPITAGISFWGQEPSEAFFGIGEATEIESISITWPGGEVSTWNETYEANQIVQLIDLGANHTPGNLRITQSTDDLLLTWGHMRTDQTFYEVQRSLTDDFAESEISYIGGDLVSFRDQNLDRKAIYYYRVRALYENTASEFSKPIEGSLSFLADPSGLEATTISEREVELSWIDNSLTELGFVVERSLTEDFLFVNEFSVSQNETTFLSEELVPGTPFYYRVKAVDETSSSGYSNVLKVITEDAEPNIVTSIDDDTPFYSSKTLKAYPNPTSNSVQLELSNEYFGPMQLRLLNHMGKEIKMWSTNKNEQLWSQRVKLPPSSGIYFVTISTPEGNHLKKLLKTD